MAYALYLLFPSNLHLRIYAHARALRVPHVPALAPSHGCGGLLPSGPQRDTGERRCPGGFDDTVRTSIQQAGVNYASLWTSEQLTCGAPLLFRLYRPFTLEQIFFWGMFCMDCHLFGLLNKFWDFSSL